ncbi:MAG: hypothetical protein COT73_02160 [Bdellovibrio sp. CG10_big_fil_rev_8_21_14_0_10_47_8]|nr:MAG: hypothetical protein COT73_02160 [Bdellovibrio sp. CG10_big_fil_rev_8_21_14_0_10_47_8]
MLGSSAFAVSRVSECISRPGFLTNAFPSVSLKSLPALVFVGKQADYYVEGKKKNLRLWGQQSFTRGEEKIICATLPSSQESDAFAIYAPALIDLSEEKKTGNSYWQFHMMVRPDKIGIWNKASRLFSKSRDLEEGLKKIGAQYQFFQRSRDEYELFLIRETDSITEYLSIRFDAVPEVK